jgi:hypothetical protein
MLEDEEAKAVQEIAKVAGKGFDLLGKAGESVGRLFGVAIDHLAAGMGDKAALWRYKNMLKISDEVDDIHKARGMAGKVIPLPPEFALPILEAASLEVEQEVQSLWAGLIANATDPGKAYKPKKVFVETLRGMQGLDAVILKTLANNELLETHSLISRNLLNAHRLAEEIGAELLDVQISLQSLARLGCVIDTWSETIDGMDTGYSGFRVNNPKSNFRLSHLGVQLLLVTSNK